MLDFKIPLVTKRMYTNHKIFAFFIITFKEQVRFKVTV